ncbi:MAG: chemotaxis-specific protein-glutamate methyltransferase CheB [Caulobacteraceae bacterium]
MTRLLVVDDSALMRRLLLEVFSQAGGFELAFARNGAEALDALAAFKPDVITLDVEMPDMDGLETLDRIMLERPTPVVMVSSLTADGAETTLRALELGAVDFVAKPKGAISLEIDRLGPDLVETVRAAAKARVRRTHRLAERIRRSLGAAGPAPVTLSPRRQLSNVAADDLPGLVLVGVSTGGPPALEALLSALPEHFPWPVLIAQHMPASFTGPLARRLDGLCAMQVSEATAPTLLAPGGVYIARGDADVILGRRAGRIVAIPAPADPARRWHPSVDRMVESAMQHVSADRLAGVLMTGMGNDGAQAMTALRQAGGRTIAEAEETAVVWGMPGELVKAGGAQAVERLERIAPRLIAMVAG